MKMVSITHTYLLIRLCPLSLSTIVKLFATHHKRKFLRQRYANAAPFGGIGLKKIELFAIKSRHKETSDGKRKKHRLTPAFCAIFFAFFIFLNIKEFERQGKSQKIQILKNIIFFLPRKKSETVETQQLCLRGLN